MNFTKEIYDKVGKLYIDDFPIEETDELCLQILNSLPQHLQGLVISWGCSDTEVRDSIFELLCQRLGFGSASKYYGSDIAKNYFEQGVMLSDDQIPKILQD